MTPEHIDSSIARALKGESGLDPDVIKIHGFSTPTMRHLFNNLCHLEDIAYLEIGVFKAASFVAAFNNNPGVGAFGVDDFSQDFSQKNVREKCLANIEKWKHTGGFVKFIEGDCFALAEDAYGDERIKFDIFTYDGRHDTLPTAQALPAFFNLLADRFIYIVDDCSWETVADGSKQGFEALAGKVRIDQEWKLFGARRNDDKIWHNGLAIYLCSKLH